MHFFTLKNFIQAIMGVKMMCLQQLSCEQKITYINGRPNVDMKIVFGASFFMKKTIRGVLVCQCFSHHLLHQLFLTVITGAMDSVVFCNQLNICWEDHCRQMVCYIFLIYLYSKSEGIWLLHGLYIIMI